MLSADMIMKKFQMFDFCTMDQNPYNIPESENLWTLKHFWFQPSILCKEYLAFSEYELVGLGMAVSF